MPTKFGRFVSGKIFSNVFLMLYVLFMAVAAFETNSAFCYLTERNHFFGIVYVLYAVLAFFAITKKKLSKKWFNKLHKKAMSFLSCFIIYYSIVLIAWELIWLIFGLDRTVKSIGVLCSIPISVLIVLVGYLRTKKIRVKPYHISMGKETRGYKIALISDIHLGIFVGERHIARMVNKINSTNPDLIVISCDIFDVDNSLLKDISKLKRIARILRQMRAREGVYAVVGNHDPKVFERTFKKFIKESGITLLDNEVRELSRFNLIGRTDESNNRRKPLLEILPIIDKKKPTVVIDHNPQMIKESVDCSMDLVLCGHTHRGQIFPVNLFTKWANGRHLFYGYETFGKTQCIITSGVGFFELPMRIGSGNEIVEINLKV